MSRCDARPHWGMLSALDGPGWCSMGRSLPMLPWTELALELREQV